MSTFHNNGNLMMKKTKKIVKLLKLKPNKKLLQQHISETTEKVVLLKDISNLQTALCNKKDRNNLDTLATKLKSIKG